MPSKTEPFHNYLLAALSPEVQIRLLPHLELVSLPLGSVVYECQQPMRYVYFPTDSIISLQYLLEDGSPTGISIVGSEGLFGSTLTLGGNERSHGRALVQSAGHAYRIPTHVVIEEFNRHGDLLLLMLRYTQSVISQVSQTAACNRNHKICERLCRWLLISMDRLKNNHLTMTQDFIAHILGVRREGVTEAALKLQRLGVISYHRGLIDVIDRPKLEEMSCECYHVVRKETDLLLDYVPQHRVHSNTESIPASSVRMNVVKNSKFWGGNNENYANPTGAHS